MGRPQQWGDEGGDPMKEYQRRKCRDSDSGLSPGERGERDSPRACEEVLEECTPDHGTCKKRREHQCERVCGTADRDRQEPCPGNLVRKSCAAHDGKQKKQEGKCGLLRVSDGGSHQ